MPVIDRATNAPAPDEEFQLISRAGTSPEDSNAHPRVAAYIREHPWAILPKTLDSIVEIVRLRSTGARLSDEEIRLRIGAATPPAARAAGKIAVVPVFGVVSHRMNMMTQISGGTSTEQLAAVFQRLVKDPDVAAIVLDIDSPGGSVAGVEELGDVIYGARGSKPIIAVANSMAASAAYWLASQADELVVTPSGQVGSIGVFGVHEDLTKAAEKAGVKVTYISAGPFKTEGQPFVELTEEARADLQAKVDEYYETFLKAVARGRGVSVETVRDSFGGGRLVSAAAAASLGMVDRVETLEATLARLGGTPTSASAPRAQSQETPTMSTQATDSPASQIDVAAGQIVVSMDELQALRDKAARADRLQDRQQTLERESAEHAELLAAHRQEKIAFKLRGVKLPAFRPFMRALLEMVADAPGAKTYVVTDAKNPVTAESVVDALIAELNHQAEGIFKTFSAHVPAPRPDPDEPEEIQAKIDYRVKQYCRANKLDPKADYKAALEAVLNADSQLKTAYTAA